MKNTLLKFDAEKQSLQLSFESYISDKSISLKERSEIFYSAKDYMKKTIQNLHDLNDQLPLTYKYITKDDLNRNEVFEMGYEVFDTLLFLLSKIEEDGRDYQTITKIEYDFILSERDLGTFEEFKNLILVAEEMLSCNAGFVVIDW